MDYFRLLAFAWLLVVLGSWTHAELVVGRVVDPTGNGIGGIDIDVANNGSGGDPDISNDGTDPNGFFAMTVSDFGVFDIEFNAPPPGATTFLSTVLTDVLVVGTVDLGTIVLNQGAAFSGRVVDASGFPVANVNLDVFDASGTRLVTPFDRSDAFGNFLIGVPLEPIAVGFDARPVLFPLLASQRFEYSPTADINVGDIVLPPGVAVSGAVRTLAGLSVENADLDFTDSSTGVRTYTPGDNTDEFGNFSVTVPVGVYDIQVCPMTGQLLVSQELDSFPLIANTSLGVLALEPGFVLSGTVSRAHGGPARGVDVDIEDSVTGATIALCDDNTNAAGFYSVILPTGVFDITFTQRCSTASVRTRRLASVVVTGNQALNASLPSGPCSPVQGGPPPTPIQQKTVF